MKKLLISLLLASSTLGFTAHSLAEAPKVGEQFDAVAQPISTDNPAKIEVMELFWYGCPHCHDMEAPLNAWVKKLPADVYFKRMPALPNQRWAPMAKAFYAMEALNLSDKLHAPLFDAIHNKRTLDPSNEQATIDWMVKASGLDRAKVEGAFKSFSMNSSLSRAAMTFRNSGATGVPSLIIDGKYVTSVSAAGGNEQALKVADYIIDNVRKDKAAAAKK